jgi:hypothetical protein
MPLAVSNRVVFHQDSATPHNTRINVAFLNNHFGDRWMGTYGPIRWSPRSPDLNPLDFFLWGYIRNNVYLAPRNSSHPRKVKQKDVQVCQEIPPNFLLNATMSVSGRYRQCLEQHGDNLVI